MLSSCTPTPPLPIPVCCSHVQLPVHRQVWAAAGHPGVPEGGSQLWVSIIAEVPFTVAAPCVKGRVTPACCWPSAARRRGYQCWGSWQRPFRLASSWTLWGGWQLVIGWASDAQWSPTISVTVYKQQEARVLPDCGGVFWRYFTGTPLTHMRTSTEAWRSRIPALQLLDLIDIILDKALSMWSDLSLMPVLLISCQVCLGVWDCISYLCSIQQRLIQWEWTAVTSGAKCWPSFANTVSSV